MVNILIFSLIFSIYYRFLFWTEKSGISILLYFIPFLAYIIYLLKRNNKLKNKKTIIWCVPIVLLSVYCVIFNNEYLLNLNFLIIAFCSIIFLIKVQNNNSNLKYLFREIAEAIFIPIGHLGDTFHDIKTCIKREKVEKEDKKRSKNLFKGIIITFFVVCVVLILLASADLEFSKFIFNILGKILQFGININIYKFLWEAFLTFLMFLYLSNFLKFNILKYEEESFEQKDKYGSDNLTIKMVLIALNIIYFIFIIIQVKSLMVYKTENLSEIARQGFFQLMIVSLINFIAILIASYKQNFENKKSYLVVSSIIMILFTAVFTFLSGIKMYQYEAKYGYTVKRTIVYFILTTEFVLLIPTLFKILGKDINLSKVYFGVIISVYLIMNFSNLNWIVAQRNLNRFYNTGKIDIYYLSSLGTDATSQMIEIFKNENISIEDKKYLASSIFNFYEKNKNIDFRYFNLSKFFINKKIEKIESKLKENNNYMEYDNISQDDRVSYYDGTYYGKIGSVKYKVFNTYFLNNIDIYDKMFYQNQIYYMQIENYDTYCKYKNIFTDILDMSKEDFDSKFMIIAFPENYNEMGIKIDDIFNSYGALNINFTRFNDYEQNTYTINENGFSIIIPRSMEREVFGIGINKYNNLNNESSNSLVAFHETHDNEKYTKEESIQIALDYIQKVSKECTNNSLKEYYSKFTKVYEVNEFVSQKSNNYWDLVITNTPINNYNLNLGAEESTYEIILISPNDDLEIERAYFYVNPYTGQVIAGKEMSD